MPKKDNKKSSYEAKDIYVLEGLEPVRRRPGMYIGSTGSEGLHHLIWECVDNSLDEASAGYAKNIEVTLLKDNKIKVKDDGRGIPVDKHPQTKLSALETVMTTLHAGGKFGGQSYKIAGGLHGVGVSVVNALSIYMKAEICRNENIYIQEYSCGKAKTKLKKSGKCQQSGTTVIFEPDSEIFKDVNFKWFKILKHLRQQAYLTKGVKIIVKDERKERIKNYSFYFDGGIVSYVKYLNRDQNVKHDNIFYVSKESQDVLVEVAFQYTNDLQGYEEPFANNIHTGEGGMHITGFRTALTRTLNNYAHKNGFIALSLIRLGKTSQTLPYLVKETVNYPLSAASWFRLALIQRQLRMHKAAEFSLKNMRRVLSAKGLPPNALQLIIENPKYDSHPDRIPKEILLQLQNSSNNK